MTGDRAGRSTHRRRRRPVHTSGHDHRPRDRPSRATAGPTPDPRRWKALAVCLVAGFMTLLDVSIVNVALPSIRGPWAPPSDLQWVVSGYALTFGLTARARGPHRRHPRPAHRLHRRRRALRPRAACLRSGAQQRAARRGPARPGRRGGILNPQVSGLIQQLFRGAERGTRLRPARRDDRHLHGGRPRLGGVIIDGLGAEAGWRWIFFVNLPIGIAAVVLAMRLAARPAGREGRPRSDLDRSAWRCSAPACSPSCFPLVEGQQWTGDAKWALLAFGLVLIGGFVGVGAALRRARPRARWWT